VGAKAAELVAQKKFGQMVALRGNEIVGVSLEKATAKIKTVTPAWLALADTFFK
jgi:6-phosphofructokinase 1